jgi:hypothetical protein
LRDHVTWRANWLYSEYHELRAIDRGKYRHYTAAALGVLTVGFIAAAVHILAG